VTEPAINHTVAVIAGTITRNKLSEFNAKTSTNGNKGKVGTDKMRQIKPRGTQKNGEIKAKESATPPPITPPLNQ